MSAKSNLSSEDIANSLLSGLTKELRIWAKKSAWPEKVVEALSVKYVDGAIVIDKPEEVQEEIDSLEYGGGGGIYVLPNAVIRPFIYRAAVIINDTVADAFADYIVSTGGIWA